MRVAGAAKAGVSAWGTTLTLPSPASGGGFLGPNAIALGVSQTSARDLSSLARPSGAFAMLAVDQREGLRAMLASTSPVRCRTAH